MSYNFEKIGKELEKELLGVTRSKAERRKLPEESIPEYIERLKKSYLELEQSFSDAKDQRAFSPTDPYPAFACDVYNAVADTLERKGMISVGEFDKLKYYTAVGPDEELTPLDFFHGIDAFLELEYKGKLYLVTLDLKTTEKYDPAAAKADIIHAVSPDFAAPATYKNKDAFPQVRDLTESQLDEYTREYQNLGDKIVEEFVKKAEL